MKFGCQILFSLSVILLITSSAHGAPPLPNRCLKSALIHHNPSKIAVKISALQFTNEKLEDLVSRSSFRLQARKKLSRSEQKNIAIGVGVLVGFAFMTFVCISLTGNKRNKDPKNLNKGRKANQHHQRTEGFVHGRFGQMDMKEFTRCATFCWVMNHRFLLYYLNLDWLAAFNVLISGLKKGENLSNR
jgi:hypothetical protein